MTIEIEDFRFKTIIGVLDFEREKEQEVVINLKASYSYENKSYIDYVQICNLIKTLMQKQKFFLLEEALVAIKEEIFKEFELIDSLYLKISKPNILKDCIVSLSNRWEREYLEEF